MTDRVALIEQRLRDALMPERLEIVDDSAAHAGHAGAREGGHFTVRIVSTAFRPHRLNRFRRQNPDSAPPLDSRSSG